MQIALLGELEIRIDAAPIKVPSSRKARLLLAMLATRPGRQAREVVADELWGGSTQAARNSLSGELKHLRALSDAGVLVTTKETIGLPVSDQLVIDVRELDAFLDAGQYEPALELWRGDFLQDTAGGEWAAAQRVSYRRKIAQAMTGAADNSEDLRLAIAWSRRAHELVPEDPLIHEGLILRLRRAGDVVSARAEFEGLVATHARRGVFLPERLQQLGSALSGQAPSVAHPPRLAPRETHAGYAPDDLHSEPRSPSADHDTPVPGGQPRGQPVDSAAGEQLEAELHALLSGDAHGPEPLSTGFVDLDEISGGFPREGLTVIAGRPNMGATLLALTAVTRAATEFGKRCLIFSPELSETQLAQRLIALRSRIDGSLLAKGVVKPDQWPRVIRATESLSKAKLYVDDTAVLTVDAVRTKTERLALKENALPDIVMVDDAHLLSGEATLQRDSIGAAEVLHGLRTLGRTLGTAVVATTKVLVEAEHRVDKRPLVEEIPGYRKLAARPDLVLLLYRDEYYWAESDRPGEVDVIVAENRQGPTGVARLAFLARGPCLADLARERADD